MENNTEEKITIGSDVVSTSTCSMCGREFASSQPFTMQNASGEVVQLCVECKEKVNEAFDAETKNPNMPLAVLAGIVGGAIGGVIWYLVAISTGMEIGYISLGLGYLVGYGVYLGAGKKRGSKLQFLSAFLALLAIFVTEKYIYQYFLNQYIAEESANDPEIAAMFGGKTVSISFSDPDFLQNLVSPMGLLIYALGIYVAYGVAKAKKI